MQVGDVLEGRLELRALIGEGGSGQVFKAWDNLLQQFRVVKALLPALGADPASLTAMKFEVMRSQQLSHPNIVSVYDYRLHEGRPYIVMQFVDGVPLNEHLASQPGGRLDRVSFFRIADQILAAVEYAHENGVIHRDLKPANVMIVTGPAGRAKVMDFGIAATLGDKGPAESAIALSIPYSSPEQIRGDHPSVGMDIYALGCMFYELLSGHPPFHQGDVLDQHLNAAPRMIQNIGPGLNSCLLRCLAKDPARRPQSATTIRRELGRLHHAAGPARWAETMGGFVGRLRGRLRRPSRGSVRPRTTPSQAPHRPTVRVARRPSPNQGVSSTAPRLFSIFESQTKRTLATRARFALRRLSENRRGMLAALAMLVGGGFLAMLVLPLGPSYHGLILPRGGAPNVAAPTASKAAVTGQPDTAAPTVPPAATSAGAQAQPGASPTVGTGVLVIDATPWAEIVDITDGQGTSRLPTAVHHTPMVLSLPPGTYRVSLRHPDAAGPVVRQIEVAPAQTRTIREVFRKADAAVYFGVAR